MPAEDCRVLQAVATAVGARRVLEFGPGESTQALLDAYTLRRELGEVDGLKVALIGDLRYGRTVHSLARLLTRFEGVELVLASPPELSMPEEITRALDERSVAWSVARDLTEAIRVADVAYVTRIQAERFEDPTEAARLVGQFVVNRRLLDEAGRLDLTMLHPLPRYGDLSADLDDLPGAAWFRQSHYGVPVRMALFCAIMGEEPTIA